jgi:hypothetical protein
MKYMTWAPVLPGDNSEREPPDPISNSEVKTFSADDSLGFPHAKVGHCQALNKTRLSRKTGPFFLMAMSYVKVGCSRKKRKQSFSPAKRELSVIATCTLPGSYLKRKLTLWWAFFLVSKTVVNGA